MMLRSALTAAFALCAGVVLAQDEAVLGDFEGALDAGWEKNGAESTLSFEREHATRGDRAVKVIIRGQYPGINLGRPPVSDWSTYDKLKIDLFNTSDEVLKMQINLRDRAAGGSYQNRANLQFSVRPGANDFEFNLTGLKATNGRVMDRSQIVQLLIMFSSDKPPAEVFVDNVRLVKEKVLAVEGLKAFDFGTADSPVFGGFSPVTERTRYDEGTGFGWTGGRQLVSADHVTPGALERDWVRGPGTFAVKVPNGGYHVWLIGADSGNWGFRQHWSRRLVKAEGRTVIDRRMTHDEFMKMFFENLDVEDLPGQDIYMLYIESRWAPVEFDVEVTDGRLDVEFAGDPWATVVNAMVVYPSAKKDAGEGWMEDLADRRRRAFYTEHVEVPVPEKAVEVFPNAAEKKRGYAVFQRPWSEPVWPTSSPKGGGQEIDTLEVSVARGEYEPVTFSIYPFRDLGKVTVQVDVGFPMDALQKVVEGGYVQYKVKRAGFKVTRYQVQPLLIRRTSEVRIDRGVTRRFWLTLHVPEGIPGGTYAGSVVITPEAGEPTTLPLTVTVHGFALPEPKDCIFSLTGTQAQGLWTWVDGSTDVMWRAFEATWRNQRAHGLNGLQTGSDLDTVRRIMTIAKPHGVGHLFRCSLPWHNRMSPGVVEKARALTRTVVDEAKKNKWPEPVFVYLDEPSNGGETTRSAALELARALRELKDVKLMGDLNHTEDEAFYPLLDYAGINNGCDISPATFKKIRDAGSQVWLVNAGKQRFWWGIWFYKVAREHGVRLKEDYAYQTWHGDPFYDLDAWNSDYCAAYPGPEGDINTPWFEELREGIDDFRYLWMLERMVGVEGELPGGELGALYRDAGSFLTGIRERVNADWSENKPWPYEDCQAVRMKAAEFINKFAAEGVRVPE